MLPKPHTERRPCGAVPIWTHRLFERLKMGPLFVFLVVATASASVVPEAQMPVTSTPLPSTTSAHPSPSFFFSISAPLSPPMYTVSVLPTQSARNAPASGFWRTIVKPVSGRPASTAPSSPPSPATPASGSARLNDAHEKIAAAPEATRIARCARPITTSLHWSHHEQPQGGRPRRRRRADRSHARVRAPP